MGRPQNNGLIEFVDEKPKLDNGSWNCMDFQLFEFGAEDKSWEAYHARLQQAKSGNCPYRDRCTRYSRTMERHKGEPRQLTLF